MLQIVLGSSSKGRKEVLKSKGYQFTVMSPDIDEKQIRDKDPSTLTLKIAHAKATALLQKIPNGDPPAILITSDQVVVCNNQIREKPENEEECKQYLRSYAQYPAVCYSSVVVTNTATGERKEGVEVATQHFRPLPEEFIDKLVKQGDVLHCAGGFAIELMQDYLDHLDGNVETVVGLPLLAITLLEEMLKNLGNGR